MLLLKRIVLPVLLAIVLLLSVSLLPSRAVPLFRGRDVPLREDNILPEGSLEATSPPHRDSLSAMFWNLENFFDWRNDSTSVSDADFSSRGSRRWTRKRFETKCQAIVKTILWASGETGRLPDVIGFAEVENSFVLKRLLRSTLLRKLDYKLVHYDSPDRRGIDVALLYRAEILELIDSKPCHLYTDSVTIMPTRDILLCRFLKRAAGAENSASADVDFAVLVNHHPSKYGGTAASDERRRAAVSRLRKLADSLAAAGTVRILALGDFNDTPKNPVYRALEPRLLPLYETVFRRGEGTIRFDGRWELIDLAFASPSVPSASTSAAESSSQTSDGRGMPSGTMDSQLHHLRWAGPMRILRPPFLRVHDTVHGGWKPLRTYSGPRYIGGVSDHCPILVRFAPE